MSSRYVGVSVHHPDIAAKLPQNDPLIQEDGLRDSRRVVGPVECGTAAVEDELFGDKGMRDFLSSPRIIATVAMLAAAAGGCAQLSDVGSVNLIPSVGNLSRPDWLTYSGAKDEFALRPITAADLVSAEGQCAMAAAEAPPTPDTASDGMQQASLLPGGIALQMTECDVVRRAGAPEQIQIADERGERSVVITYIRGPRPGIYRFAAGRLASIERAPEAPGAKAAPKAKSSKKAARS